MKARSRSIATLAVAASLATNVLLVGCTAAPATSAPSPSTGASTSAASGSPTITPPSDSLTIDITITGETVDPSGKKIDVKVGQTVVLNVTSDKADEIHAHTGGDGYELEVPAGKLTTGTFVITEPGSFEVESHHLEKTIVILNAR